MIQLRCVSGGGAGHPSASPPLPARSKEGHGCFTDNQIKSDFKKGGIYPQKRETRAYCLGNVANSGKSNIWLAVLVTLVLHTIALCATTRGAPLLKLPSNTPTAKTQGLLPPAENSPQLLPDVQVLDQIVKVATTAAWSDAGSDFRSVGTSFTDGKRPLDTTVRTSGMFSGFTRRWLAKM